MKGDLVENSGGTGNNHNGYMEDMYILRFYVTKKRLSINEGNKFDENELFDENDKISVFEVRRDKKNNMVLWHLESKEEDEWEAVDGEIQYNNLFKIPVQGCAALPLSRWSHCCQNKSENGIQKSYTINAKFCEVEEIEKESNKLKTVMEKSGTVGISDIPKDSQKNAENTVNTNNTNIFDNGNDKSETHKSLSKQSKQQSNYHIGKTVLFVLLSIGVGLYFGWLYALIPLIALIVLMILDQKFDCLPGPKKILYCFKCYSVSEFEKSTETINPELMVNNQNKNKDPNKFVI